MVPSVRFDDLTPGQEHAFEMLGHVDTIAATTLDQVVPAIECVVDASRRGLWSAGFVAYEAAPAFDRSLPVRGRRLGEPMPDLPPGLMSLEILGTYLGPGIAAAAAEMPEGSSAVFARRGRWLVVRINARERSTLTDLSTIRNRVLLDYRRKLADETLETYIEDLRQRADVTVAQP